MEKGRLGRSIVRNNITHIEIIFVTISTGALNWATGETVAVKEIQLSNIPKGEIGEIMVSDHESKLMHAYSFPRVFSQKSTSSRTST